MDRKGKNKIKEIVQVLEGVNHDLMSIINDEEIKLDNLSNYFEDTPKMQEIEEYLDYLNDTIYDVENAIDNLSNI